MKEKDIMNDYLSMINSSLSGYGSIISQTDNNELRQTIQQMRNQDELRQYKLYKTAKDKGYYKPAQQATQDEVNTVKSEFTMETDVNSLNSDIKYNIDPLASTIKNDIDSLDLK